MVRSAERDVLLVERFDRPGDGSRRSVVSALTIIGLQDTESRHGSYADLATANRYPGWRDPAATLRELFLRLVLNVCIGNSDDHLRNHVAFWDGAELALTPAYDSRRSAGRRRCRPRRSGSPATASARRSCGSAARSRRSSSCPRRRAPSSSTTSSAPSGAPGRRVRRGHPHRGRAAHPPGPRDPQRLRLLGSGVGGVGWTVQRGRSSRPSRVAATSSSASNDAKVMDDARAASSAEASCTAS